MPAKRFITAHAANEVNENALSGLSFEFPETNVNVVVAATTDAGDDVDMEVQFGSELVMERSSIRDSDGGPIIPDNVVLSTPSIAGRRLSIRLFNNAAAAANATILIETTPL